MKLIGAQVIGYVDLYSEILDAWLWWMKARMDNNPEPPPCEAWAPCGPGFSVQ